MDEKKLSNILKKIYEVEKPIYLSLMEDAHRLAEKLEPDDFSDVMFKKQTVLLTEGVKKFDDEEIREVVHTLLHVSIAKRVNESHKPSLLDILTSSLKGEPTPGCNCESCRKKREAAEKEAAEE